VQGGRRDSTQAQAPLAAERHVDILELSFADNRFDRVLAEAVTMFVDRPRAARELVRVCRPGGRVLTTEFLWRKPPTPEARQIFLGEVCPGMNFNTLLDSGEYTKKHGFSSGRLA